MKTKVTITGIADVNRLLAQIAPREAKNLMRATVQQVATEVAKVARQKVHVDQGVLKAAIRVKRERGTKSRIDVTVRVGTDAYYWRFLEYGQGPDGVEHAFFLKALQAIRPDIDRVYLESFVRKLEARLARLAKRSGG